MLSSLFDRIMQEQERCLLLMNYSERMVDSTAPKGQLFQDLRNEFRTVVMDNFYTSDPARFSVAIKGRFGDTDQIEFNFSYRYDPIHISLNLIEVKAVLNETYKHSYPVTKIKLHLPSVAKVHKQLKSIRAMHEAAAKADTVKPKQTRRR